MARSRDIALTLKLHRASGRLYKCIGRALGKDGQPKPKIFYFDPGSADEAVREITGLRLEWKRLRAERKHVWDESPLYLSMHKKSATCEQPPSLLVSVVQAKDEYLQHLKRQWEGGQFTKQHYTSQRERLNNAVKPIAALPLAAVNRETLDAAVLRLCSRPMVQFPAQAPHQMSATYAKASIRSMKWCFDWLAEEGRWTRCRQWSRVWKKDVTLTDQERQQHLDGTDAQTGFFTVDELKKLWQHASDFQRCLILCGLNMAFSNAECSSLTTFEVKGIGTHDPYVERYRRKTVKRAGKGAYGKWHLWPETVEYLLKCRAAENTNSLWFLSQDGRSLNDYGTIIQGWRRLVKRAEVRNLGFRFMRKTAAHLVRTVLGCGSELADQMLSHADARMLSAYAGRDWEGQFKTATLALRSHLEPMFAQEGTGEL